MKKIIFSLALSIFSTSCYSQKKYAPFTPTELAQIMAREKYQRLQYFSIPIITQHVENGCKEYLYTSYSDIYYSHYSTMNYEEFVDSMGKMILNKLPLDFRNKNTDSLCKVSICEKELTIQNSDQLIDSIFDSKGTIKEKYYKPSQEIVKLLVILSQRGYSLSIQPYDGWLLIGYRNKK